MQGVYYHELTEKLDMETEKCRNHIEKLNQKR